MFDICILYFLAYLKCFSLCLIDLIKETDISPKTVCQSSYESPVDRIDNLCVASRDCLSMGLFDPLAIGHYSLICFTITQWNWILLYMLDIFGGFLVVHISLRAQGEQCARSALGALAIPWFAPRAAWKDVHIPWLCAGVNWSLNKHCLS